MSRAYPRGLAASRTMRSTGSRSALNDASQTRASRARSKKRRAIRKGADEGRPSEAALGVRRVSAEPERRWQGRLLRRHDRAHAGTAARQPFERDQSRAGRHEVRCAAGSHSVRAPESADVCRCAAPGRGARQQPAEARIPGVRRDTRGNGRSGNGRSGHGIVRSLDSIRDRRSLDPITRNRSIPSPDHSIAQSLDSITRSPDRSIARFLRHLRHSTVGDQ